MSMKTVTAALEGDGMRFVARTGSGHLIEMDDAAGGTAATPAELLLVAQAGCTAMDVISILRKKQQRVDSYEVRVAGQRREEPHPRVFERILVIHAVEGDVTEAAVRRAIELSASKYCTVTANLASGIAEIRHAYVIREPSGEKAYGEVLVTGPHAELPAASPVTPGQAPTAG